MRCQAMVAGYQTFKVLAQMPRQELAAPAPPGISRPADSSPHRRSDIASRIRHGASPARADYSMSERVCSAYRLM